MTTAAALEQLDTFAARFLPEIAARGLAAVAKLRSKLPTANVLIYDNYNALAVGFAATEKTSTNILSIAFYPRWVSLFLANGPLLDDSEGLLKGNGTTLRHIVLDSADHLDRPAIAALIDQSLGSVKRPLADEGEGAVIVKSVSAKQRPRRPTDQG